MRQLILVKYGELALKGKNRPEFERVLARNLGRALELAGAGRRGVAGGFRLRTLTGRMIVELGEGTDEAQAERLLEAAARVFGVVGVAPARPAALDPAADEIGRVAVDLARAAVASGSVTTFKVEVKRPNKGYPLKSPEVAARVGRRVQDAVHGLEVDVHQPELRLMVEIRDDGAYLYGRERPGPGGLPVGTSGKVIALLSGGIDSPVAVWMAMKRGVVTVPLHFWSFPFTGERAREKVVELCRVLGGWGLRRDLLVCPFTELQTAIRDQCPEELRVTIMRRMMLRIATRVAAAEGALGLVTGESLGQVASQTLESLGTIEAVTGLPVLRPLVGLDKEEIIQRARAIGTFEISTLPYEDCCTLFVPAHPRTRPTPAEAEDGEASLDIEGLIARAVAGIERIRAE